MAGDGSNAAFAYHEPPIATVLNHAGFLVALNLVNVCLDKFLYCGLIGQLFIGILWGTPGAKWLGSETEAVIQQLGYLGLIMLVYEGGLATSIKAVKANLIVSLCVAITGICVPMGLSFILKELVGATSLQAFAAGAALSATSLGTTLTILSTTDLIATRLGTVTTSAAMLDDVVGLVMVQIISNLGGSGSSFGVSTVIRPIFVSIGFAVGVFLLCACILQPIAKRITPFRSKLPDATGTPQFAFIAHTVFLVGFVAGATYAGTSSLFAAYLTGVIVSWFDGLLIEHKNPDSAIAPNSLSTGSCSSNNVPIELPACETTKLPTGQDVYEKYYRQPANRILIPLFFASIGFAIPITEMFRGSVIWRGIIYAVLMVFGKMITGLWLVRFSLRPVSSFILGLGRTFSGIRLFCLPSKRQEKQEANSAPSIHSPGRYSARINLPSDQGAAQGEKGPAGGPSPGESLAASNPQEEQQPTAKSSVRSAMAFPPKPKSLYSSSILGLAMVARGEVGYLVASLAQSQGIFATGSSAGISEIYLVVVWGISICTLVGPICVGSLVKRVKKLQMTRGNDGPDPLGVWGI
ncbi:Sodium/hydrogen exchanger family-domain-containing protein [Penicillium macrosclerotiorum]|uniref:Sodium/hydrogen exchanger family-domain-containing protein n=1 Tax=Penicillium macrosclerotiorum TaxID=303699 RepID=UPI00254777C6|nr:Sodium/hydrogen exchanger family-domain-containing protein [Penicillium macrosclerotiorum]KAJ5688905.1 Sodium/hydrogen exchanger family-domain-containing protein [Penicillium macrosclerotiorum]